MKTMISLLVFGSLISFGQDPYQDAYAEVFKKQNFNQKEYSKNSEIIELSETTYFEKDTETGAGGEMISTLGDTNRFTFGYLVNLNYSKLTDATSFELTYQKKWNSYNYIWWGLLFKQSSLNYGSISENSNSGTNTDSESQFDKEVSSQTLTSIGVGPGFRFNFLTHVFQNKRIFEHIGVYFTYNRNTDEVSTYDGSGLGLVMDYEVLRRFSRSFFVSFKVSHNITSIVRESTEPIDKVERSYSLSWSSMGVTLGTYF